MILDKSAIVAIVFRESGWERMITVMGDAAGLGCGGPTLAEAGIVVGARSGFERSYVSRFVQTFDVETIPHGSEHWIAAVRAYDRFGKGRHRASLDFGDCLTYATAHLAEQPLLCIGADFSETDLPLVEL